MQDNVDEWVQIKDGFVLYVSFLKDAVLSNAPRYGAPWPIIVQKKGALERYTVLTVWQRSEPL